MNSYSPRESSHKTKGNGGETPERNTIDSINVIRHLTNNTAVVDEDTVLLITSGEVLTKEGIHGPIAPLGIGFGTGRHTNQRHDDENVQ
jgi:hypothetical protein